MDSDWIFWLFFIITIERILFVDAKNFEYHIINIILININNIYKCVKISHGIFICFWKKKKNTCEQILIFIWISWRNFFFHFPNYVNHSLLYLYYYHYHFPKPPLLPHTTQLVPMSNLLLLLLSRITIRLVHHQLTS